MPKAVRYELKPSWWHQAVGMPRPRLKYSIPRRAIRDLADEATPTRMSFYSYLFRPNYSLRRRIIQKIKQFDFPGENISCAAMHVRRGDILLHPGQARHYIPLRAYVQSAQAYMNILGIRTILLLTDSQMVIDEAKSCSRDFPDICRNITWRYIEKKRWYAAEGGWENPFPSGNPVEEFTNIQLEFALSQKCDLMIQGNSGFGDLVFNHMCCKFPIHDRGELPQRCLCPPKVRLKQTGFTCEQGNKLFCGKKNRGGEVHKKLDDPENMLGANFSRTKEAIKEDTVVHLFPHVPKYGWFMLSNISQSSVRKALKANSQEVFQQVCLTSYDNGPTKPSICQDR